MEVSPIESSRGNTPIVSIHLAGATVPRARRWKPPTLRFLRSFSTTSRLFLFPFSARSSCRLTLLPSPLFSFFLLFPSFLFFSFFILYVFFFLFCSTSLSLGYFTIRPPADIKLHKQRDAPEGLFALLQIFSDCSRAACRTYAYASRVTRRIIKI